MFSTPFTFLGASVPPLWTPADLSTGPRVWYDASETSTIILDAGVVSEWQDISGNGNDLVQATGAGFRPGYVDGWSSLKTVSFDGSDDRMLSESNIGITGNSPYSIFSVFEHDVANTRQTLYSWGDAAETPGTASLFLDLRGTDQYEIIYNGGQDYRTDVSGTTDPRIYSMIKASGAINTTTSVFFEGVQASDRGGSSTSTPILGNSQLLVGTWLNIAGLPSFFDGKLGEILIVPTNLGTTDRQKVEGYLAWKWDLESLLPIGHPYKNNPPYK